MTVPQMINNIPHMVLEPYDLVIPLPDIYLQ